MFSQFIVPKNDRPDIDSDNEIEWLMTVGHFPL